MGDNKIEKKAEKKAFTYIIPCDVLYLTEQWLLDQIAVIKERNKPAPYSWQGTKDLYGWRKDTKDDKDTKTVRPTPNPKGYRLVLDRLTELFILGKGTTPTFNMAPGLAYDFLDHLLVHNTKANYMTSFKHYFINEWFGDHFFNTNLDEEEVIGCIRTFTGWETQKNKWITKDFNDMLDELEKEVKLLRKVQGHSVVRQD